MARTVDPPSELEVYNLYQGLLDYVTNEIFKAPDDVRHALEPVHQALTTLLDNKDVIALEGNEAKFTALTPVMKTANAELEKALASVEAVDAKMNDGAKVIEGITKLLNLATELAS